jgi:hypothetical protein
VNLQAMLGLIIMIVSEAATLAGLEPFASWNTPTAWTGFILFADGIVFKVRGQSWLRSSPREFAFLALMSIPLWLVFEFFNRYLVNWHYVGLPENRALRLFGYAWSFATIWPAIFEAADLIEVWREKRRANVPSADGWRPHWVTDPRYWRVGIVVSMVIGAAMLAWPIVWPSPYLAAPVWLGFIFLLDPINNWLGRESLIRDLSRGDYSRLTNLILSGFLCGVLWEFWNYWARAKWHYTVPIMENLKIFEMPVPGYLGFPAFALECFTMYVFVRMLFAPVISGSGRRDGRPVGVTSAPLSCPSPATR